MGRWPPGCDAYMPLEGVDPPEVVYVPAWWCARAPLPDERWRAGDDVGRRATVLYLNTRFSVEDADPATFHGFMVEGWLPG